MTDRAGRRPIVIDTDGGVDDAVALWWALTDDRLDVLAITVVWGNVDLEIASRAVLLVLDACDRRDVPVALGAAGPIAAAPDLRPATFIHGDDGLGNTVTGPPSGAVVDEPAGELLARLVAQRSGEVSLVTLGPLSTIGHVLQADRSFARNIDELVVMGGSARGGGNALPWGEANVAHDPLAAQAVVTAEWQAPPLLVGLDVTHEATLGPDEFTLLAEHRTAGAAFLDAPMRFYRRFGSTMTAPGCPCHDLLAVMALIEPEVITEAPVLPLAVDCSRGPAWGATVVDFRAPFFAALDASDQNTPDGFADWRIALHADAARFRRLARAMWGD